MFYLLSAALLFGMVHPGSKFFLNIGTPLLPFCLFYIGIRLMFQLPIVIKNKYWKVVGYKSMFWLIVIGLVGAGLQYFEFKGIEDHLPVGLVSFLVYTHPVWTLTFGRFINKEKINSLSLLKILLAVCGVVLLTQVSIKQEEVAFREMLGPLLAGVCIALWIVVSNRCKKLGASAGTISFYYDLFAFVSLALILWRHPVGLYQLQLAHVRLLDEGMYFYLVLYSLFVGYLPNLLFYIASGLKSALTCGLVLLLEPVISSLLAWFIWQETLSPTFLLGAALILLSNIDFKVFTLLKRKRA